MVTQDRKRPRPDDYFADWKEREALAEAMIPTVGSLSRERNVKCYIYGRSLVKSVGPRHHEEPSLGAADGGQRVVGV